MFFDDLPSPFVGAIRIVIVHAYIVGAEGTMIVHVGLVIGYGIKFIEHFSPPRGKNPSEQLVLGGIVVRRPADGHPVLREICEAHPETVCLYAMVAGPVLSGICR